MEMLSSIAIKGNLDNMLDWAASAPHTSRISSALPGLYRGKLI